MTPPPTGQDENAGIYKEENDAGGISDNCKNELKRVMDAMPVADVSIPSLTLELIYHMKYLKEGGIVNYESAKATFHVSPADSEGTDKKSYHLLYNGEKYFSLREFADKVNRPDGRDYSLMKYNGISSDELKENVKKYHRLMGIIREAIDD